MLKKSRAAWIAGAVVVALLATATVLVNMPPLTECRSETQVAAKQYWFRATQTMARPWLGPHHVYGIFTIPEQYKFDHLYTAKLRIQGIPAEFKAGSPEDEDIFTVRAEPGRYVKRVYVSTRTALWFLLTGRFGDLRTSCHWWLVLVDRGWQPTGKAQ
ncbi:MAG TPA: hypothetical protein VK598_01290 [Nitrospiraceae bacterium]|nr:hypothetical protein [Nitrospiraceae bacterium]